MSSPGVARRSKPPCGVAGFPWNQWQVWPGIGGSFAMESVATFVWNRWQLCYGISGSFPVESVAGLAWNTQTLVTEPMSTHLTTQESHLWRQVLVGRIKGILRLFWSACKCNYFVVVFGIIS